MSAGARRRTALLLAASLSGVAGCSATWTDLPGSPARGAAARAGALRLAISDEGFLQRGDGSWASFVSPGLTQDALSALRESGWFAAVGPEVGEPALEGTLVVRTYQGAASGALLSLLTAFVVPARETDRVEVQLAFGPPGTAPRSCTRHGDLVVWRGILFFPLVFTNSGALRKGSLARVLALGCADELLSGS
jgi:hypothetical protein